MRLILTCSIKFVEQSFCKGRSCNKYKLGKGWRGSTSTTFAFPNSHIVPLSISLTSRYDSNSTDNRYRSQNVFTSASGASRLRVSSSTILPKVSCLFPFLRVLSMLFYFYNTQVSEKEFEGSYYSATDSAAGLRVFIVSVWWKVWGNVANPMWADVDMVIPVSPLTIIYFASFSILITQNRGKQRCSIFFLFNSQQRHHRLIRYHRLHPP